MVIVVARDEIVAADVASEDTNEAALADVVAKEILSIVVAGAATLLAVSKRVRSMFGENGAPLVRRLASVMIS